MTKASPCAGYMYFRKLSSWSGSRKACHYLDFTNMKINQISPLVGIDDTFYFSRLFTKIMGISPTEYRAHKKG